MKRIHLLAVFILFWVLFFLVSNSILTKNSISVGSNKTILNLRKIPYILNNHLLCSTLKNRTYQKDTVKVLQLITSHAGDVHFRNQIRNSISNEELTRINVRRMFLLAKVSDEKTFHHRSKYKGISEAKVQLEYDKYGDVLVGDFYESYQNLTYKHVMGITWAAQFCSHAKYVVKQDDDVIFDVYQLVHIINEQEHMENSKLLFPDFKNEENAIFGKLLDKQTIIRDPKSKWYVPANKFKRKILYPPFVSGWAYITTIPVINSLLQVLSRDSIGYFEIDDAFVTGVLREKTIPKVKIVDISKYFTVFKGHLHCCVATTRNLMAIHKDKHSVGPFWCDFLIGPSIEDLSLIDVFHKHAQFCYTTNTCVRRSSEVSLKNTCVVTDAMMISTKNYTNSNTERESVIKGSSNIIRILN